MIDALLIFGPHRPTIGDYSGLQYKYRPVRLGVEMPSKNAFYPQRTYTFLDDPEDMDRKSSVFLSFTPSDELQTCQELMEYLRTALPTPLSLRRLARGRGTSVEVQTISESKIVFGYSPPTTNPDADAAEIAKFIQLNKIPAVLS